MYIRIPVGQSSIDDKLKFETKIKELFPSLEIKHISNMWNRYQMFGIMQVIFEMPSGVEVAYMRIMENLDSPFVNSMQYWEYNADYLSKIPNIINMSKEDFDNMIRNSISNTISVKQEDNISINTDNLDHILIKIANDGYESLNIDERKILNNFK